MQSSYQPPAAPLGPRPLLPVRSLWSAVAAGFAASFATIVLISFVFAIGLAAREPGLATTGITLSRMQQLPGLLTILLAIYALAGLVGGWCAAQVRRRRSTLVALALSVLFAATVCTAVFLAGRDTSWAQIANLGCYTAGALLGGGVARRRDEGWR